MREGKWERACWADGVSEARVELLKVAGVYSSLALFF